MTANDKAQAQPPDHGARSTELMTWANQIVAGLESPNLPNHPPGQRAEKDGRPLSLPTFDYEC